MTNRNIGYYLIIVGIILIIIGQVGSFITKAQKQENLPCDNHHYTEIHKYLTITKCLHCDYVYAEIKIDGKTYILKEVNNDK